MAGDPYPQLTRVQKTANALEAIRLMVQDLAALMANYCDGDESAFRELYAVTAPSLLAHLRVLMRDRTMAEELLQQTFFKVHLARHTYERGSDPLPWLFTISHRTALDELRRAKRTRQRIAGNIDGVVDSKSASPTLAPESEIDERWHSVEVALAALATLPESQRAVIVVTKLKGKSTAEAALLLGTTPGAIRVRAHRGYIALRKLLRGIRHIVAAVFISSGTRSGLTRSSHEGSWLGVTAVLACTFPVSEGALTRPNALGRASLATAVLSSEVSDGAPNRIDGVGARLAANPA